MTNEDELFIH